jgi:hypothetical protein
MGPASWEPGALISGTQGLRSDPASIRRQVVASSTVTPLTHVRSQSAPVNDLAQAGSPAIWAACSPKRHDSHKSDAVEYLIEPACLTSPSAQCTQSGRRIASRLSFATLMNREPW